MRPHDRTLLLLGVAGFALSALAGEPGEEFKHFVPVDKKLAPEWVAALTQRGTPEVWRGKDLVTIGMPVGGIAAGQLYLRGDGTLAQWWVFNKHVNTGYGDRCYRTYRPDSPVESGFAVAVERRVLTLVAATLALGLAVDLLATPIINRFKSGRDLVEAAGPYLRDADEVILYQSDYSGVYNLFARRTRMPVVYKEEELRKALKSPRRVAVIAKESKEASARDIEKAAGAHLVAQERVGHRKILVLANWHP